MKRYHDVIPKQYEPLDLVYHKRHGYMTVLAVQVGGYLVLIDDWGFIVRTKEKNVRLCGRGRHWITFDSLMKEAAEAHKSVTPYDSTWYFPKKRKVRRGAK